MFTSILAAVGALGSIASLVIYLFKRFKTTPEEAAQTIGKEVQDKEQGFKDSGRPT